MVKTGLILIFCAFMAIHSARADAPEVVVGATLPLTGKLSFIGVSVERALRLACDEVNSRDNLKIRLEIEDNRGEPSAAVSSVNSLVLKGSSIILSPFTHITQAIAPIVERNRRILLYWAGLNRIAESNSMAFKDWGDAINDGISMVQWFHSRGLIKIAVVSEINDACMEVIGGLRTEAGRLGIILVSENQYNPGETSFQPMLLKAASKAPQGIAFCAFRDSGTIMKQMKALSMMQIPTAHVIAPFLPINDTPEARSLYEENGAVSTWFGLAPEDSTSAQHPFVKKFLSEAGTEPRMEAAFAYDGLHLIAIAAQKCLPELSVDCIAGAMNATSYPGVSGTLKFDDKRRSIRPSFLLEVRAGKWQRVR